MIIEVADQAEADLSAARRFYERQAVGVGSYFLESLLSDLEALRLLAGIHRRYRGHYRMLSKRFPFAIYYQVDGDLVQVRRVLDCRRDPYWIGRQLSRTKHTR